jgi:5-formyltetrahydrofolate cyclo-ligase
MQSAPDKSTLRKLHLSKRLAIAPGDYVAWSFACQVNLATILKKINAAVVAGYVPIKNEVNILCALVTALPVVKKEQKQLLFYPWKQDDELLKGTYGIEEPVAEGKAVTPDVIIVPLLAFDRNGHRLGYGAGHYDATLYSLRKNNPALLAIGAAFSRQETDILPPEPHDERIG